MYESVHYEVSKLTEEDSAWWEFNTEVLVELAEEYRKEEWERRLEESKERQEEKNEKSPVESGESWALRGFWFIWE